MEDGFQQARELAGLTDAALVTYRVPGAYVGHYYADSSTDLPQAASPAPAAGTQINLLNLNLGSPMATGEGPFYYLWLP